MNSFYLKKQIALLDKNEKLFSNVVFFDNIGDLKNSEKILYYYQRNFNIVRDIIIFDDVIEILKNELIKINNFIKEISSSNIHIFIIP